MGIRPLRLAAACESSRLRQLESAFQLDPGDQGVRTVRPKRDEILIIRAEYSPARAVMLGIYFFALRGEYTEGPSLEGEGVGLPVMHNVLIDCLMADIQVTKDK